MRWNDKGVTGEELTAGSGKEEKGGPSGKDRSRGGEGSGQPRRVLRRTKCVFHFVFCDAQCWGPGQVALDFKVSLNSVSFLFSPETHR